MTFTATSVFFFGDGDVEDSDEYSTKTAKMILTKTVKMILDEDS